MIRKAKIEQERLGSEQKRLDRELSPYFWTV
jgi:hypothetical protein